MLKHYMDMLGMDANGFYQMLISLLAFIIPTLGGFFKGVITMLKQQSLKKIFELYCKRENDNFFAVILGWEIAGLIIGVLGALAIDIIIRIVYFYSGSTFKWKMELLSIISVEINCGFLILMAKNKRIRERLLGDKKGTKIIACSMMLISIILMSSMLNNKEVGYTFSILYFINEIIGLWHFQGRYIKYEYSFMSIYLKSGEKIICEQIEKAKRKKDFIILEERNKNIVLPYDRIEKVEYYGPPKFVLAESIRKKSEKK